MLHTNAKEILDLIKSNTYNNNFSADDFSRQFLEGDYIEGRFEGFNDLLEKIDKIYNPLITDLFYYGCLQQYLYADGSHNSGPGGFDHFFNEGFLNTAECQTVSQKGKDGEYDLDILKRMTLRFSNYMESDNYADLYHLTHNLKIILDDRETISHNTEPREDFEKLEKRLKEIDDPIIELLIFSNSNLVFENGEVGCVLNVEKLYEETDVLIKIFSKSNMLKKMLDKTTAKLKEYENRKEIELIVCGEIPETGNGINLYYYEKKHPKANVIEIKKMVETLLNTGYEKLVVYTCCDHVVNYVRYANNQLGIDLTDDKFIYFDAEENYTHHTIKQDGKIEPELSDNFFDASLKYIYNLKDTRTKRQIPFEEKI